MNMFKFFKNYQKQLWAFFLVLLFIFVNYLFPAQEIKSEDCQGVDCGKMIEEFSLSSVRKKYSRNNIFDIQSGDFFRIIFKEQSDKDTIIYIKLSNSLGEEQVVGELDLKKSEDENIKEIIFQADRNYSDLIFEKKNNDDAGVSLYGFRLTKLNIKNQENINSLESTIFGKFENKKITQTQNKNEISFSQLVEPKIIVGQVFKADTDFISDIEVDIDVTKQGKGSNGDVYQFIIRKAKLEGNVPEIKNDELLNLSFSIGEIERYRQSDGKFKFPAYVKVQEGEYYFWGVNNDKADPNRFNCLKIRGTDNSEAYKNGMVAIKKSGESFSYVGDLYFSIYGAERKEYKGKEMLLGATIEDLGEGEMIFKYQTSQKRYDLIDLEDFSGEVFFDEKNKSVAGINKKSSNNQEMIYKFEPPNSFKKFKIYAQQTNIDCNPVSVSYSFDNKNWNDLSSQSNFFDEWQIFDQEVVEKITQKQLYLKIKPLEVDPEYFKEKYGIANLTVEIDLLDDK